MTGLQACIGSSSYSSFHIPYEQFHAQPHIALGDYFSTIAHMHASIYKYLLLEPAYNCAFSLPDLPQGSDSSHAMIKTAPY
jgi:hypothetical protein